MKAFLRFALVSLGYLKTEPKEEFHRGFLFAFQFAGVLYVVSQEEAPCFATGINGKPRMERCLNLYKFDASKGTKETVHVFDVHQNIKPMMAAMVEAARLMSTTDAIVTSPRGAQWIGQRQKRFDEASRSGTLHEFYASTMMTVKTVEIVRDENGQPVKSGQQVMTETRETETEFLPVTAIREALQQSVQHELAEAAA